MAKFFLLPLRFFLFFLISAVIFIGFTAIFNWGQWFSPELAVKNSLLLFLPSTAFSIILPSVSSGLLFTFFSYRKQAINPLSALITAAAAFVIIFFGMNFTAGMKTDSASISFQPFNERKIQLTDSNIIYTDHISTDNPDRISGIITRSEDDRSAFRYYPDAVLAHGESPVLKIDEGRMIDIEPHNPVFNDVFNPGKVLGSYISDIEGLNRNFMAAEQIGGMQYFMLTAAFTAFLMACFLFRGTSVWPLFDFILILGFHRLGYFIFTLFSNEAGFISDTLFGGKQLDNVPLFTICGVSLIIFIFGLLFRLTSGRRRV